MNESTDAEPTETSPDLDEHPQRRREWSGVWRSLVLPLLIVTAIVAGLWYWQSRDRTAVRTVDGFGVVALPSEKNPTGREPAAQKGRAAPDFILPSLDTETYRLSDLQGRPIIINLWATWCVPCRAEMPELVRTYNEHKDAGLAVLAVDVKESDAEVQRFADEFGMTFPILMDRSGEVASAYRMTGLPQSYFIDRTGVIQEIAIGGMDRTILQQKLAAILAVGSHD